MPGEILSAADAVVRFSPEQVCPGYVTIAPGTDVTWANVDTVAHTVTITEGNNDPQGKPVASTTVAPGTTWVRAFDQAGVYTFTTDAIPSFRGTVDASDGTMAH